MHAIMDQVNLAFVPDVLVIPVHSTVQFPNSDAISHQVYSFSSARQFQLPLYRGKPYPPVTFDQPGVVTLGCNIHDNMLAYIVVTARAVLRTHRRASANGRADDLPRRPLSLARLASAAQRSRRSRSAPSGRRRSAASIEIAARRAPAPCAPQRTAALMGLLTDITAALLAVRAAVPCSARGAWPPIGSWRSTCAR